MFEDTHDIIRSRKSKDKQTIYIYILLNVGCRAFFYVRKFRGIDICRNKLLEICEMVI